jgi:FkbH-like protein
MTSRTADTSLAQLRSELEEGLEAGNALHAEAVLREVWAAAPSHANAAFVVHRFERIREALPLRRCKVSVLRSFTVEPLIPLLRATGFVNRLDLDVRVGGFNTYVQEILDPESELYGFAPEVVILAVQTRDVVPQLWHEFADLDDEAIDAAVVETGKLYERLVDSFRLEGASLVLHTLEVPPIPSRGFLLDAQSERGQVEAIRQVNRKLGELARSAPNVALVDYDGLVARRGREAWFDRRKWLTSRMPIAATEQIHLAEEWVRSLHALTGMVCKVVAVDLDNTLWGGIVGEDGLDGLSLDDEYPGAAYRELQRALLDLHRRGIMLAICSKNNHDEAAEVLERHPGMLLRREHFAATRINWSDKVTNLVAIAGELNIGVDAVAFLDDNPVERELVRRLLPEVTVVELPLDPMDFADAVRSSPVFERTTLTNEDRSRGRYYAEERQRRELEQGVDSVEEFLRSLNIQVEIARLSRASLARAAQLTQKTNQFNLTTRRYTEQELSDLAASPSARVYTLRAADRFGDSGVVGVAILRFDPEACEIDSFLMSCRVIGRTIETAFLSRLVEEARSVGAPKIVGRFIPTAKNTPASDFYPSHRFSMGPSRDGSSEWELDLGKSTVEPPSWIEVVFSRGDGMDES